MATTEPPTPAHRTLERLIVFTRYPEPGKTKTRLVPALGAAGAAALQRCMTEHTLRQGRELVQQRNVSLEIRFSHSQPSAPQPRGEDLMDGWLGSDLTYIPQGAGDLGEKLVRAFGAAFAEGINRVVTIGIDCPDIDAALLQQAFEQLDQHDLVLGPATDGGYYLIGLSRPVPELFSGIDWGTEVVRQQTVAIAHRLGLSIADLQPLADVDRPADLPIWQRVAASRNFAANGLPTLSVIIPVLNEAATLGQTLAHLQAVPQLDVVVVDGGSQDETVAIATALGARVISSEQGRACQMNAGAAAATSDILLFLHADTRLPDGFAEAVRHTLAQPQVVAAAFELQIDADLPGLRWVERGVKWRSRHLQMPYGDQAICLKADQFHGLGGFPDVPIMEDFELVRQLKAQGRIALVPLPVMTSGRRWQALGVLRTTLVNQLMIAAYFLGVSPERLVRWYRGKGDRPS